MNIIEKARVFATAAHAAVNQTRKYTGEPYIVHPAEVVHIVSSVPHTSEMLAAAWLHDTVEDTGVTMDLITTEFGELVSTYVFYLTDKSKPTDGNRKTRKAIDRKHISNAPAEAQTIKLADLISNTKSIVKYDPNFAVTYLEEKRLLLDVITKGDTSLYKQALNCINYG